MQPLIRPATEIKCRCFCLGYNTLAKKKMATAQAAGSTVEEKDKSTV